MASTFPQLDPRRVRSYLLRLPFFTRIILLAIILFWILELQSAWNVAMWGALVPKEVNIGTSELDGSISLQKELTFDPSVQIEYVPAHPPRISPRLTQYDCPCSPA